VDLQVEVCPHNTQDCSTLGMQTWPHIHRSPSDTEWSRCELENPQWRTSCRRCHHLRHRTTALW